MFLSNPRKSFLLTLIVVCLCGACGSTQTGGNGQIALPQDAKSRFPFSTVEPAVYQGNFVVAAGQNESHWFVARNGSRWRIDFFDGDVLRATQIMADKFYSIDHRQKIYSATPASGAGSEAGLTLTDVTINFFRGTEYREFDDLGSEGALRKYKVRQVPEMKDDVLLYVDPVSGLIVKQQFFSRTDGAPGQSKPDYTYEIRDLKLDAGDQLFQLPAFYRQVTPGELSSLTKQK